MADNTAIEWTDATWNPITGCSVVSPGCTNCYAMRLAGTRLKHTPSRQGLTTPSKAGPVWNGQVRFSEAELVKPLSWRRPRKIFVCAHGDLFHESVPDAWIDQVFAVMALSPQHTYQVLTKRAERMRAYVTDPETPGRVIEAALRMKGLPHGWQWPLANVWNGVSVEDQIRADERRAHLAEIAAAGWTTFVSYEPALGPVDWTGWEFLAWLISGGENGPRPSHPDWHRMARNFCAENDIAYFFKQWGTWTTLYDRDADPDWIDVEHIAARTPRGRWLNLAGGHGFHGERVVRAVHVGKRAAGRVLDGVEHNAMPGVEP